jgi:hypothetical protein
MVAFNNSSNVSEEKMRQEVKIIREGTNKLLRSKETARAFLRKNGFITPTGKLTKRYGG